MRRFWRRSSNITWLHFYPPSSSVLPYEFAGQPQSKQQTLIPRPPSRSCFVWRHAHSHLIHKVESGPQNNFLKNISRKMQANWQWDPLASAHSENCFKVRKIQKLLFINVFMSSMMSFTWINPKSSQILDTGSSIKCIDKRISHISTITVELRCLLRCF